MLWLRLEKQDKLKTVTLENKLAACQLLMSKEENTKLKSPQNREMSLDLNQEASSKLG